MRCNKCGGKTVMTNARIDVVIGDTHLNTIGDAGYCQRCNTHTCGIAVKLTPLQAQNVPTAISQMEAKGNA